MKLHTTSENNLALSRARAACLWLCLFLLAFAGAAAPEPASANRFLFIIDTSAGMKPIEGAVRETAFDLVYSGVRGQMTNNDTYGVWLIAEQNDTSFPMENWKSKHAMELGAKVTMHIKQRGFKGRARLDTALADAANVARNVGDLTIVLVSNGETPVAGTPFDAAVNEAFAALAPTMKKAKRTVNTVFVARDGVIAGWAVNAPEYLVRMPALPPRAPALARTDMPASNAVVKTEAAPAPVAEPKAPPPAPATVAAPVERPRVAISPIIITKETVAQERLAYLAMTATPTNEVPVPAPAPAAAVVTPVTNVVASVPVAAPVTNAPAQTNVATVAPVTNALASASAPNAAPTNAPAVAARVEERTNTPAAAAVVIPPPATLRIESVATHSGLHPLWWVIAGAGGALLITLTVAVVFLFRRRREEPSLISQAIVQERLQPR